MNLLFKTLISLFATILFSFPAIGQLYSILDFEGENFDYSPSGIVVANDSLYLTTSGGGEFGRGSLFRIDHEGNGYKLLKSFDDEAYEPSNIISDGELIYGTTRLGENYRNRLFSYELKTGTFRYLKEFLPEESTTTVVKYVTDSLIWGYSIASFSDRGSIFTIERDGSSFRKVYNDTDVETGSDPADFFIRESEIFIAFYAGGGITYYDNSGSGYHSGSIAKVGINGQGFVNLFKGENQVGTHPRSLIEYHGKIYGLFSSAGLDIDAKLFEMNLDGSEFKILASVPGRGRGSLIIENDIVFGMTSAHLFGYSIVNSTFSLMAQMDLNIGFDASAGPVFTHNSLVLGTQQEGASGGGAILKYVGPYATAVEKALSNSRVRVYPNPSSGDLHITTNPGVAITDYFIYDASGSLILAGSLVEKKEIKLSDYRPGLYLIKLFEQNGNSVIKKVLLE